MSKKDCNCKAKKNTDNLIKNIEDINKSASKDFTKGNKRLKFSIFLILKIIIYTILLFLTVVLILPIFLYVIFSKKPLKIALFKEKKDVK